MTFLEFTFSSGFNLFLLEIDPVVLISKSFTATCPPPPKKIVLVLVCLLPLN